jgi:hypothetical protein
VRIAYDGLYIGWTIFGIFTSIYGIHEAYLAIYRRELAHLMNILIDYQYWDSFS